MLLFFSFGLKLLLLNLMEVLPDDGPLFIAQAEKFAQGAWQDGLALNRSLFLYPLLIAGAHFLVGDMVLAGQLISLTTSVLALVPVYLLTRGLFGPAAAFWGGLAFVVAPGFNDCAVKVMRDPTFLCLFAWAGYFAWRALIDKRIVYGFLFLGSAVISAFFRVEGILFPVIFFIYLWLVRFSEPGKRASCIRQAVVLLIVLSSLAGAYHLSDLKNSGIADYNNLSYYLHQVLGGGIFSIIPEIKTGLKNMEMATPFGWNHNDFASIAREHIRLIYFIGLLFCLARTIFSPFSIVFVAGVLFCKKFSRGSLILLFSAAVYLLVCFVFLLNMNFIESRYVFAPAVLLFPWIGFGLQKMWDLRNRNPRLGIAIPLVFLGLFLVPPYKSIAKLEHQVVSGKEAGIWLGEQDGLNQKKMVTNNGEIPFYSGRSREEIIHVLTRGEEDFKRMEQIALDEGAELIGIVVKDNYESDIPDYGSFGLRKKFADGKYLSLIFQKKPY
ncbi:glycosyltransferase family 39 protein [Desulfuromonas versatilis]|uniref:glycosyltransferase family 39 protein n=1 Tax=Desulfuromonas versatilis TaxID=2802975 RepID=UPI001CEDF425|nr:glycosyltransferase family 39 protein [Desulfuromonas versatilis]